MVIKFGCRGKIRAGVVVTNYHRCLYHNAVHIIPYFVSIFKLFVFGSSFEVLVLYYLPVSFMFLC